MASNIPVIVQGNSFNLAIPLQIYVINGDQMELQDYTPDPTDQISIQLKGSRRNYTYTPTSVSDNVCMIALGGYELADNYSVVVSIVKANGQRLRSFRTDQFFIVESSDDLTQDDIIQGLEENVIYLNSSIFVAGEDGRGIVSIVKTSTSGLVDTYTITYSDATTSTFNVTNGAQGEPGATISSVEKTATAGLVDTYTITLSNGNTSTFDVTNGKDGYDLGLASIINNLTTGGSTDALSAEQGKVIGTAMNGMTSGGVINLTPLEQHNGVSIAKADGTLITASSPGANVKIYNVTGYNVVLASGYYPSSSGAATGIGFYDSARNYLGYQVAGNSSTFTNVELVLPEGTIYVGLFGANESPNTAKGQNTGGFTERTLAKMTDIYEEEAEENINSTYDGKYVDKSTGAIAIGSGSSITKEFYLEYDNADALYYVDGRVGAASASCLVAYYDDQFNYLGYAFGGGTATVYLHEKITPPSNAKFVRIFGTNSGYSGIEYVPPKLYFRKKAEKVVTPQIFNAPVKTKTTSDTLKILLFGSSWFECTWWYLNYLINSAGINAEIHAYYMGHSQMREWIELYKNDLSPFSGDEATRGATRNVSSNGTAWTTNTYRSNYTAQQYRDDFFADITAGDWDIIAFQQGATQAPHWRAYWQPYYAELLRIVKQNCSPNTIIGFNSTWAPAIGSTSWMKPWAADAAGQRAYQVANWDATKRYLLASGVSNMSPNGKVLWNLRQSELNNASDLAGDGVHPSNGLPIYALGLCFFQTYIAPMYGIDGDTIDWLPTSSTQKAPVSGSYYVSIDATQRALVRQLVKQAMGNRFDFD